MLKESKLYSTLLMKCPRCHQGNMFATSIFDFADPLSMPANCPVCEQRFELEVGFYWGAMFISYAISAFLLFGLFAFLFFLIDMGLMTSFVIGVIIMLLLYIYILRISRTLWLNFFVHFDKSFGK